MSVATGCGCKEVYRFPHTTYPYSSFFLQQHPYFLFILLNVFHSYIYFNKMKKEVGMLLQKRTDIYKCSRDI